MRLRSVLLAAAAGACALPAAAQAAPVVHVAPGGADAGPGTRARPYASIDRALAAVPAGGTVRVAPGRYGPLDDGTARRRAVTIRGWRGRPTLAGVRLAGASRLHLRGLRVEGGVMITEGASHIRLTGVEVTAPGANCVVVRSAARDVTLRRLHVHHCATGLGGPGGAPASRGIRLLDSRIHHATADGVQFGHWDDVVLRGNRITDIHDPHGVIHNDAVQFTGDSRRVTIAGNVLARSGGQLLFIQDALGPIDDVLVRGNLIHDSDAYAIQSQGATRVRFLANTVWRSRWGGLLVREGRQTLPGGVRRRTTDTVVEGNVLSGLEVDPVTRLARNRHNVIACGFPGAGQPCATDASFRDVAAGDYRLRAGTAAGRTPAGPARLRARGRLRWPAQPTSGPVAIRDRDD